MEPTELKLVLVGDEHQFDPKPCQSLMDDKLEWEFARCDPQQSPEHLEVRLKGDMPLMAPQSISQNFIAYDVQGSSHGDHPVSLYQVGSYGSCLSAIRSRLICAMERDFSSRGAPKICAVKSFQEGTHVNQRVPETFVNSPLPIESFFCTFTHGIPNTQPQARSMRSNSISSMQE